MKGTCGSGVNISKRFCHIESNIKVGSTMIRMMMKKKREPPVMTIFAVFFVFRVLLSVSNCPKVSDAPLKLI